jgi:O-antigen/teichoic acid export membrane protein
MKNDIVVTFLSQVIGLLASVFVLAKLADLYGETGVGFFSIVHRVTAAYTPIIVMGVSIALSRELIVAKKESRSWHESLMFAGVLIVLFDLLLADALLLAFKGTVFSATVGKTSLAGLSPAGLAWLLVFLLGGNVLYTLDYAFLRGNLDFVKAAGLSLGWSLSPLLFYITIRARQIQDFVWILSVGQFVISLLVLSAILMKVVRPRNRGLPLLGRGVKYLLSFGVPRLPLFFIFSWILSGGIFVLSSLGFSADSARYSLSFSLLRYVGFSVSSVGVVLLPHMRSKNPEDNVRRGRIILSFLTDIVVVLVLATLVVMPFFMRRYLNMDAGYIKSTGLTLLIVVGIPGVLGFELLRNVIDAVSFRPYNTWNSFVGLIIGIATLVTLLFLFGMTPINAVNIATGVIFLVLGVLTLARAAALLHIELRKDVVFVLLQFLGAALLCALGTSLPLIATMGLMALLGRLILVRRPWTRVILDLLRSWRASFVHGVR